MVNLRSLALIVSIMFPAFVMGQEPTPQKTETVPTAQSRQLAWELGSKLSLAAIMHSQTADPTKTATTYELARTAAAKLSVSLDDLPELTTDKQQNTVECIEYLIASSGRKLHNQLRSHYGPSHAALLETAIKSNLLTLIYVPGDSTTKALASAIEDRASIAQLPPVLTRPLLEAIANQAERPRVVKLVLKMHADAKALLVSAAARRSTDHGSANAEIAAKLQGIWQCVSLQPDQNHQAGNSLIWINGDKASFIVKDQETIEASFTIDASISPMRITWTFKATSADDPEEVLTEIFKLEGDKLITCGSDVDQPVPTKFEAPPDSDLGLAVYRKKN